MALYSQIWLYVNTVLLAENTTLETAIEGDIPDVFTNIGDWVGITKAPLVRSITAANVIPLGGVEFDFEKKMLDFEEIEVMMQESGSGKKCVTRGYVTAAPRSSGVGQVTTLSFSFKGKPTAFI